LLFFLQLVTFINYFLVLRRARGIVLLVIFIVSGKGCALILFFKILILLRGRGRGFKFMFYFSPSFDMWKEKRKGPCFFLNFFFALLSG